MHVHVHVHVVVRNPGHTIRRPPFNTQAEFHSGRSLQGDSGDACANAIDNTNDKCAASVARISCDG
eukprot:scaffold15613_cov69-Phaeocystis_antarctica.AAC.1